MIPFFKYYSKIMKRSRTLDVPFNKYNVEIDLNFIIIIIFG